jgi:hypothetical protein
MGNLKLLSKGKLVVSACDGTKSLASANTVFKHCINGPGVNLTGDQGKSKPTDATEIRIWKVIKNDLTFVQMFGSIGNDLDKMCLTEHQIKTFCKDFPNYLCPEGGFTEFLFKIGYQFFIAEVHSLGNNQLDVHKYHFGYDHTSSRGKIFPHYIVVPVLNLRRTKRFFRRPF